MPKSKSIFVSIFYRFFIDFTSQKPSKMRPENVTKPIQHSLQFRMHFSSQLGWICMDSGTIVGGFIKVSRTTMYFVRPTGTFKDCTHALSWISGVVKDKMTQTGQWSEHWCCHIRSLSFSRCVRAERPRLLAGRISGPWMMRAFRASF